MKRPGDVAARSRVAVAYSWLLLRGRNDNLPRVPEAEDREIPSSRPAINIATPAHRAIVATVHQP